MLWLTIILVSIVTYLVHYYYDSIRALYMLWNVTGPPTFPLIGSAHLMFNKTQPELFQVALHFCTRLGDFFKFWVGSELKMIIQDPNDIEIILNNGRYMEKAADYYVFKNWLGDGMLLSTGKKYHDHRKIVIPAFNYQMLEKYAERFDCLGKKFIKKLREYDEGADIEMFHLVNLYALDVICETTMGVSIDAMSKPTSNYAQAIIDVTLVVITRMVHFALRHPFFFKYSKLRQSEEKAIRVINDFTDDVIRKRRQELIKNEHNVNDNGVGVAADDIGIRKKRTLLDILLQATIDGEPLCDQDIREEVDVFMFGGHDTVTAAITFCLYLISKNPEVQQKCYDEIVSLFGDDAEQPATLSVLNQLSYLELTIKETLRLFPPIPIIARIAKDDIELTNNRIIPRGASFGIPFYTVHRSPKYFEDAEKFKPERFLEEQTPFTYLPFSFGLRTCPGQKFALYEMKSILSRIIQNFEISLTKDSEMEPILTGAMVLRPESAIKFNLKCRTLTIVKNE